MANSEYFVHIINIAIEYFVFLDKTAENCYSEKNAIGRVQHK